MIPVSPRGTTKMSPRNGKKKSRRTTEPVSGTSSLSSSTKKTRGSKRKQKISLDSVLSPRFFFYHPVRRFPIILSMASFDSLVWTWRKCMSIPAKWWICLRPVWCVHRRFSPMMILFTQTFRAPLSPVREWNWRWKMALSHSNDLTAPKWFMADELRRLLKYCLILRICLEVTCALTGVDSFKLDYHRTESISGFQAGQHLHFVLPEISLTTRNFRSFFVFLSFIRVLLRLCLIHRHSYIILVFQTSWRHVIDEIRTNDSFFVLDTPQITYP